MSEPKALILISANKKWNISSVRWNVSCLRVYISAQTQKYISLFALFLPPQRLDRFLSHHKYCASICKEFYCCTIFFCLHIFDPVKFWSWLMLEYFRSVKLFCKNDKLENHRPTRSLRKYSTFIYKRGYDPSLESTLCMWNIVNNFYSALKPNNFTTWEGNEEGRECRVPFCAIHKINFR